MISLDQRRNICLSFSGVTEDIKWGADLCFCVGEKMFCITGIEPPHSFTVKVNAEEYDEMILRPGISPAPYLARAKWVRVEANSPLKKKELE